MLSRRKFMKWFGWMSALIAVPTVAKTPKVDGIPCNAEGEESVAAITPRRIPISIGFDPRKVIGYMVIDEKQVFDPLGYTFATGVLVDMDAWGNPIKLTAKIDSLGLVPDERYLAYLKNRA